MCATDACVVDLDGVGHKSFCGTGLLKTLLCLVEIKYIHASAVTLVNYLPSTRRMRGLVLSVMSQEAILEKVRSIVSEQLSVDAGEVKPDSNFQNDLGADSLDTVELVMALEEAFDIEIPDEAAEGIATVGDLSLIHI